MSADRLNWLDRERKALATIRKADNQAEELGAAWETWKTMREHIKDSARKECEAEIKTLESKLAHFAAKKLKAKETLDMLHEAPVLK